MKYYQERCEGSTVEIQHCTAILNYKDAKDPEAAGRLAGDAANHINDSCASMKVHAIPVDRSLRVCPHAFSNATAADYILTRLQQRGEYPDFLFVAGDGRDDEIVFQWANNLSHEAMEKQEAERKREDAARRAETEKEMEVERMEEQANRTEEAEDRARVYELEGEIKGMQHPGAIDARKDSQEANTQDLVWSRKHAPIDEVVTVSLGRKNTEAQSTLTQGASGMFLPNPYPSSLPFSVGS